MSTVATFPNDPPRAELREWAEGLTTVEAGVELLIRGFGGRFARKDNGWIHSRSGRSWIDFQELARELGVLSSGERGYLRIAISLAEGNPVDLAWSVTSLDPAHIALVLAAIAHVSGQYRYFDQEVGQVVLIETQFPWPA